ncbi:MAG: hypothetical protein PWP24_1010 [Clostridiales bacterium]|nr:hypothetical protein [Clostridiales bacterium]
MIEIDTKTKTPLERAGFDMIYLVACSLHGMIPEQSLVKQMNLTVLYRMAKYHSLTAMVCMALESSDIFLVCEEEPIIRKWKEEKEKAIRKNLLLDTERSEIISFMEKEGIWYMPLKGILLKKMYPKFGMRQMADNDILYDERYQKELLSFMTERGYKASQIGKGNHDVYTKAPVYNYELHTSLYGSMHDKSWEEYYRNVKQRLLKDRNNDFGYHFKAEDFYIYLLTHTYKHYSGSGTGLRSLVDTYVYLQHKEVKFNWHYVSVELEELKITEFERESRQLCKKIFSKNMEPLTEKECDMLTYYLGCGTYGTMKNNIEKKLRNYQQDEKAVTARVKIKYYVRRLIPDREHYKNYAPLVYRHKWLIPCYLVFRVIRGLICKGKKIRGEIKVVHEIN